MNSSRMKVPVPWLTGILPEAKERLQSRLLRKRQIHLTNPLPMELELSRHKLVVLNFLTMYSIPDQEAAAVQASQVHKLHLA